MIPEHFQRLRTLTAFEVRRVERALARLRAKHYPSVVAHQFIALLCDWLDERTIALTEIGDDFAVDPEGATDRLKSEHRKIIQRLQFLDVIENSSSEQVPWSIIPSVERLAEHLIPDRKILTSATSELNYAIQWYRGEPDPVSQFFILFVPKLHRANAFLHLLIGHELFHPILDEYFTTKTSEVAPILRDGCKGILDSFGEPTDLFTPKRLDRLVGETIRIWRRALEELMCDLGCACILGPSALLSSTLFGLSQNLDELPAPQGNYYPPWRYRLRTIARLGLDSNDESAAMQRLGELLASENLEQDFTRLSDAISATRDLTKADTDVKQIQQHPLVKLAYESVEASLPSAWEYVRQRVESVELQWTVTIDQIPHLMRHLELLVPPGEVVKPGTRIRIPASISGIALAGWIYLLRSEASGGNGERDEAYRRTCRLMLKAFEDSELKRKFLSQKAAEG